MTVARIVLLAMLVELSGLAILSRLSRARRSGPGALGLSFFVGVMGLALWTHLLLLIRVPVNAATVATGGVASLALGRWGFLKELVWKRPPWVAWLLVPGAGFLLYGAASFPLLGLDPAAFYDLKAKSIVAHGTFWNEDFTEETRPHLLRRRPLLLPSIYADLYLLAGTNQGQVLRLWFALLHIGALAALYDVLRGRTDRTTAAAAAALFAFIPGYWRDSGGAITGYADAPLGMIFLFALSSETPLAVFMLSAGALLKDEGMAFLVPFALCRNWRAVLIPGVLSAAWMATAKFLPRDLNYFPQYFLSPAFSQVLQTIAFIPHDFVILKHWSLFWFLVLAVLAARARQFNRQDARWLLPLVIQLCIYTCIYLAMPASDDQLQLTRWSAYRYLMHVAPAIWVWAAARSAPPVDVAATPVKAPHTA